MVLSDECMAIAPGHCSLLGNLIHLFSPKTCWRMLNIKTTWYMTYAKNISHLEQSMSNFTNYSPSFDGMLIHTFFLQILSLSSFGMPQQFLQQQSSFLFGTAVYFLFFKNRNQNQPKNFNPIAHQIEHQLSPEIIHTKIKKYLEKQHHTVNINILK